MLVKNRTQVQKTWLWMILPVWIDFATPFEFENPRAQLHFVTEE